MFTSLPALLGFLRQPTTIAGISGLVTTFVAVTTHQMDIGAAVPIVAGSITAILMPDNTGAKTAVQSLATDVVKQVQTAKIDPMTDVQDTVAVVTNVAGISVPSASTTLNKG